MCATFTLLGLLGPLARSSGYAQETPSAGPATPTAHDLDRPIGIALSGGVSLGAYEAGFLHGVLMPLRAAGMFPSVLTGTSAGSINAFVGAIEACTEGGERPTDSLLYRVWIPMGLDKLFVPRDATAVSALSRSGFAPLLQLLEKKFKDGLDARCDVRLGFSVTRERPRAVPLGTQGAAIPRMTEHILVRLRGRGRGKIPLIENAGTRELGRHHMLLPLDGPDARPYEAVASTLLASSGFPLAFPPQVIRHCEVDVAEATTAGTCRPGDARPGRFIDGGFFDNRPIGLALSALRDLSTEARPPILAFIDAHLRTWPTPTAPDSTNGHRSALSMVVDTLIDFIDTAQSIELDRLLTSDPLVTRALHFGHVYFPPASEPLGAFFGFVDEELRRFDFYLGLYHARRFRAVELGVPVSSLPDDGDPRDPAWRPLFCLRALLDGDGDPARLCAGPELADFRAIARHTIERVAEDCRRSGDEGEQSPHPICVAIARGGAPTSVPGVDGGDAPRAREHAPHFQRGPREGGNEWTLRRLAELGFRFRGLGLKPGEAWRAPVVLRDRLAVIVDELSSRQALLTRSLYRVVGDVALNLIAYAPPRHLLHVLLGNRLEVGYSWTDPTSVMRWLRLEITLGLWGLDTLFSDAPNYFGIAPSIGFRFEPLPWSRSLLQPRLSLHGGFLFSTSDNLLSGRCDVAAGTPCSRPLAEAAISVAIISVLRLQLSAVWMPAIRPGEKQAWSITPGVAIQFPYARRVR